MNLENRHSNRGCALPAIMGARCAAMDRPAIAYPGAGAWGMSILDQCKDCV